MMRQSVRSIATDFRRHGNSPVNFRAGRSERSLVREALAGAAQGDRTIEVAYESLVADQEGQTLNLFDRLGLDFEQTFLDLDKNATAIATARSVQAREKIHARSANQWKNFERVLQPLREMPERAGITGEWGSRAGIIDTAWR